MIIDKLLSPAIELALSTFTVSTQVVGEVMDMGADRNHGLVSTPYGPAWRIASRDATSGGAATATFTLVTDDNEALGTPTVLYTSPTYTLAQMDETTVIVPMPDTDLYERYLAWRIAVGTAVFTGGTLSIEYAANHRRWRAYPAQGNQ